MSKERSRVQGGASTHHALLRLVAVGLLALAAVFLASSAPASPRAVDDVLPTGQTLAGADYDEWLNRWTIWSLATPSPRNPLLKAKNCKAAPQPSKKVWLLSTLGGGKITITCTIPAGRALYVPLVVNTMVETEKLDTFAKLRSQARSVFVDTKALLVTIDGVPVASPRAYRANTRDLTLDVPQDNILGLPGGGKVKAVAAGYSLLATGLAPGKHTIVVSATIKPKGKPAFKPGQTYQITIR